MRSRKRGLVKILGFVAACAAIAVGTSVPAQRLLAFPGRLDEVQGQNITVPWSRWLPLTVATDRQKPMIISGAEAIKIQAPKAGHYWLRLRLFGWIPWRGVPVDVMKPQYVIPGGESLGIVAHTRGVMVTGFEPIYIHGRASDPAVEAGIERGDVIMRVDGTPVAHLRILQQRIARDGAQQKAVHLLVQGARTAHERTVMPIWHDHAWHIGVIVQDKTSGVGTLTFYNAATHQYTALGHSISDGLTRRPVGLSLGRVTGAEIVGIVPATQSQPGQKVGILAGPGNVSGTAGFNGRFGVVGHLDHRPILGPQKALPLALPDQVHPGPAKLVTVLAGQVPESFAIDILKTAQQYSPEVKGIMFKVTDPRLLEHTGGIIQGMSGSPIIQNGRLVGAVTHVLVNRPNLGFGCYAYWMASQKSYRGL